MTKLFVDTEFNSFRGELISIALVDESGTNEWYRVLPFLHSELDPWVLEHVEPVLGQRSTNLVTLQNEMELFLAQYPDGIHIIADWPEDIQWFCWLLITGPGQRIATPPLTTEIRRDLDATSEVPHNALADARAIRTKYLSL